MFEASTVSFGAPQLWTGYREDGNPALLYGDYFINPRKINIEPGNDGLEDDFPLPGVYSQVPC